ncbi:hypothetical protein PF005_g12152 [Phytophthora fragariae]|nr:hypothetical protein PF009_g23531 [Phytophthora fragariae]KAE9096342.1 hypothetical protein PF006_g23802 [Phytophthora fragariae]KAE9109382.1 hypothetical protein PF007_g12257 [Phytophthora fragariae]KAE9114555.1 hypothetical protein PF010_g9670 [Phytophthora fragariae]KAE9208574.1 hypothetical protein PF005_g12152 [Phytophthora fragariae]
MTVHLLMVLFCFRLIYEKVVTIIPMNGGNSTALLNTMLRGRLSGHFVVCTCTSTPMSLEVLAVFFK